MSNYNGVDAAAQGNPNLGFLAYLQDNLGPSVVNSIVKTEKISITASGTSGVTSTNIPVGSEIIDVVVHSNATSGSGTVQVSVGGGGAAITDAITMAVADAVTRCSSIDQTYKIVTADGVTATTNGDTDLGDVYVHYKK